MGGHRHQPGRRDDGVAGSVVTIIASPNTVMVPVAAGYTAGAAHDALVAAGLVPTDASAGTGTAEWNWYLHGHQPGRAAPWWRPGRQVAILATATSAARRAARGPQPTGRGPAAALISALDCRAGCFLGAERQRLVAGGNHPTSGGSGTRTWAFSRPSRMPSCRVRGRAMGPLMATPSGLTTNDWLTFSAQIADQAGLASGHAHPAVQCVGAGDKESLAGRVQGLSAGRAPGQIPPTAWAAWKYDNGPGPLRWARCMPCKTDAAGRLRRLAGAVRPCRVRHHQPALPRVCRCSRWAAGPSRSTLRRSSRAGRRSRSWRFSRARRPRRASGSRLAARCLLSRWAAWPAGARCPWRMWPGSSPWAASCPGCQLLQPGLAARLSSGADRTTRAPSPRRRALRRGPGGSQDRQHHGQQPGAGEDLGLDHQSSNRLAYLAGRGPVWR